ncbi:hypothetical protein FOXYSP1_09182 [Fusarium oxysporum f. sp. phaseoli]
MIRPFAGPLLRSRGPSTLTLGERGDIEIIGRASRKMAANRKLQVEAEWDVVNCFSQTESIKSTVSRLIADVTARSIVLGFSPIKRGAAEYKSIQRPLYQVELTSLAWGSFRGILTGSMP